MAIYLYMASMFCSKSHRKYIPTAKRVLNDSEATASVFPLLGFVVVAGVVVVVAGVVVVAVGVVDAFVPLPLLVVPEVVGSHAL